MKKKVAGPIDGIPGILPGIGETLLPPPCIQESVLPFDQDEQFKKRKRASASLAETQMNNSVNQRKMMPCNKK